MEVFSSLKKTKTIDPMKTMDGELCFLPVWPQVIDNLLKEKRYLTKHRAHVLVKTRETCKLLIKKKVFPGTEGKFCLFPRQHPWCTRCDSTRSVPGVELTRFTRCKRPQGLVSTDISGLPGALSTVSHLAQQSRPQLNLEPEFWSLVLGHGSVVQSLSPLHKDLSSTPACPPTAPHKKNSTV